MRARRTCRVLAVLLLALPMVTPAEDGPGAQRVRFHTLGVAQGLSQATARSIAQDGSGFLWVGTQDGLNRFDGHEFEVYRHRPGSAEGLGDNHIYALAVDDEGALWIGTQAGGLTRRDPRDGSLRTYRHDPASADALAGDQVHALVHHPGLGLVAAAGDGVLQRREGERWTGLGLGPALAPGPVRNLRVGPRGHLLIAGRNGAWRCQTGTTCGAAFVDAQGLAFDAYDVLEDDDGGVWVGSAERGLFRFDAEGRLQRHLLATAPAAQRIADNAVRRLLRDRLGRLWVATNNGLTRLGPDGEVQRHWRHRPGALDGLPASRLQTLYEDRDGLLWVGTWTGGLAVFDPRTERFQTVAPDADSPASMPWEIVAAISVDDDGSLWFGLPPSGGLAHFDLRRGLLAHYRHDPADPRSLSHNFVQYVTRDRAGTLWVATQGGGLNRLRADGRGFDRFRHDRADPRSLPSDYLLHLHADGENALWVGTLDAGLARLCSGCAAFERFAHDPGDPTSLGGHTVNSVFEDAAGNFWVALRPGGLNRLDRARRRFERIVAAPGVSGALSSNTVTVVYEDQRRRLWVGTQGGGLNLMQPSPSATPRFRTWSRTDGLGSDAIGGVREDRSGRLWISTTAGLSRLDPVSGRIENFGERDGAQGRGYFISSHAQLPDGRLVFGGLAGVTLFDPEEITDLPAPPPPRWTRVRSLGVAGLRRDPVALAAGVSAQRGLRLPHPARDLTLEFSALAFAAPDAVSYRYRLDGLDTDWIDASPRRRFAAYTNLQPGTYRFRAQAMRAGLAGEEASFDLRVEPAPWQTGWARVAMVAVGLALLVLVAAQFRARWRERDAAGKALRDSEERLKLALWGTGDELWDMDLDRDEMRRLNPLPQLAAPRDEQVSSASSLRRFIHPDDVEAVDRVFRAHARGETDFYEQVYRVQDVDGNWRYLHSRGRVVSRHPNGRARRIAGTVRDITDVKHDELELQRLNVELAQRVVQRTADLTRANAVLHETVSELRLAQRQLVDAEKMAALGELVAGVAHEINTPLGIGVTATSHLQSETERLQRLLDAGELSRSDLEAYRRTAQESTQLIQRNLDRAAKLVRSFKQVAVDQSSGERRHIALHQYLDEILTSLRPALKRTRHRVLVECPDDLELTTMPGAVYQIVVNLVMNSVIHAFDEGQSGEIRIEAARRDGEVVLTYADNGRGMSEEARRRIYEPFFTTRRGRGGSGLGMHIVFNLVTQALRGSIECDSAPGQGVYFSIRIPLGEG